MNSLIIYAAQTIYAHTVDRKTCFSIACQKVIGGGNGEEDPRRLQFTHSSFPYRRGNDSSVGGAKIGEKQSRQSN